VLDHSCSKLGFGGKMCLDGTKKFEEEIDDTFSFSEIYFNRDSENKILTDFPEIHSINSSLIKSAIPCLLLSVKKDRKGHIRELHQKLVSSIPAFEGIKIILYVEHTVNPYDLPVALWRFCNNLDPKRDNILIQQASHNHPGKNYACMGFDGTRKTKELDDFHRDWPNIIVADDETINAVDRKWEHLGIGPFISSPSLKYKEQLYGEEAAVR
jgi:4-hydroxy-3-polyprenylbenzoate decarboxylase